MSISTASDSERQNRKIATSVQPFDQIWHDDASEPFALDLPLKFSENENPKWCMCYDCP